MASVHERQGNGGLGWKNEGVREKLTGGGLHRWLDVEWRRRSDDDDPAYQAKSCDRAQKASFLDTHPTAFFWPRSLWNAVRTPTIAHSRLILPLDRIVQHDSKRNARTKHTERERERERETGGDRSIPDRSMGERYNRSTNDGYTRCPHLVGRDPCRGRRWSAPVSGIYLLLAGARALLPRLPFIPPLRPAGEFSTLTLLQARHDAILQAVPDQPGSIDILVFDSIRCARCCPPQFSGETHFRPSPPAFQSPIPEDPTFPWGFFDFFFYVSVTSYSWLN